MTRLQAWTLTAVPAQLLRGAEDSPLAGAPLWERGGLAPAALVSEFQRECRVVRKGVDGDLHKARTGPVSAEELWHPQAQWKACPALSS